MVGLAIPNKTAKIMRASANLRTFTKAKPFSGFYIIWVHNQNSFQGYGLIPITRAESF